MSSLENRRKQLTELYQRVFERAPDESGMKSYLYSDTPIEQIEVDMRNSLEFAGLQRKKNFGASVESLGSSELLLMGSSPNSDEHVSSLKKTGIEAVLNLDSVETTSYSPRGFEHYLNVPLDKDKPIPLDSLKSILDFLYLNIVLNARKTFVHSDRGVARSPMIVVLFLVADKKRTFSEALNIVITKQKIVNPSINLVSADVLEATKNFVFEEGCTEPAPRIGDVGDKLSGVDVVKITNNLAVGRKLTSNVVQKLKSMNIDVVLDLNLKKQDLPTELRWFSHIHIPTDSSQLDVIMKVVLRSANKYSTKGKVYVVCEELGILLMFVENYINNFVAKDSMQIVGDFRKQLMSL